MALLGNAYLGVMLVLIALVVVAATISVVWLKAAGVKIAILMAVLLWLVLKALWVGLAPPEGTEITARDAQAARQRARAGERPRGLIAETTGQPCR